MGAGSGAHTVGGFIGSKSPLGDVWGDGLNDLEAHGYQIVKELAVKPNVAILVARRTHWPEQQFAVKAFANCRARDLRKAETGPLQEAMILRGLEHPNIVKYVEAWWTEESASSGRLAIVMEYAEDGDLHIPRLAMRRRGRHLEELLIGRWLQQILDALVYLHTRGIVHRDLKTSNVFLKDSWRTALLGDFGISSVLATTVFSNTCAGTPGYMAPETVRSEPYGTAVDIWAVGIILYELMALQLPFIGSLVQLVYKISCVPLNEGLLRQAGYSEELITIVRNTAAKEARSRPTAKSLLEGDAFWSLCCLEGSEEIASQGCSENRLADLTGRQFGVKGTTNSAATTAEIAVLDSWSSSEPIGFALGDFFVEQDNVIRSALSSPCNLTAINLMQPEVEESSADEVLRKELHDAHTNGIALSPEYLSELLSRLGVSE